MVVCSWLSFLFCFLVFCFSPFLSLHQVDEGLEDRVRDEDRDRERERETAAATNEEGAESVVARVLQKRQTKIKVQSSHVIKVVKSPQYTAMIDGFITNFDDKVST